MMRKFFIPAACLVAAPSAAWAQPPESGMSATLAGPARAFGECMKSGIAGLSATVTPEAGASAVMAGCATQRAALEAAVETMIADIPEAQKAEVRSQMRSELANAQTEIAAAIRKKREATAPSK